MHGQIKPQASAVWATRPERGSAAAVRLMVWLAVHLGRRMCRVLILPVCLYYVLACRDAAAASRDYIGRALGRKAQIGDGFRQVHCFASCLLDRIYLLRGRFDLFDIRLQGEAALSAHIDNGEGCLLYGAHFGSFEAVRATGRAIGHLAHGLRMSLVMYEENARKTGAVLAAINPDLALDIIPLGRPGAMLAVQSRLDEGQMVGLLADRGLHGDRQIMIPFLGTPAGFPEGPFRMATLLRRPVVAMFGIYRGGNRYDIVFEALTPSDDPAALLADYVARLDRHCRDAPYNWFNFYKFWDAA